MAAGTRARVHFFLILTWIFHRAIRILSQESGFPLVMTWFSLGFLRTQPADSVSSSGDALLGTERCHGFPN
jgi:hypothetical protein